jgi:hypothetical protein
MMSPAIARGFESGGVILRLDSAMQRAGVIKQWANRSGSVK